MLQADVTAAQAYIIPAITVEGAQEFVGSDPRLGTADLFLPSSFGKSRQKRSARMVTKSDRSRIVSTPDRLAKIAQIVGNHVHIRFAAIAAIVAIVARRPRWVRSLAICFVMGATVKMLIERNITTRDELRREYFKMQRALFIQWLADHDTGAAAEMAESEIALKSGQGVGWKTVREEINNKHYG